MHADPARDFHATLLRLVQELDGRGLDWRLFGGAALALYGVTPTVVADIDVLTDHAGARALIADLGLENQADAASGRFRSDYLLRPGWAPVPVEIMAGFRIRQGDDWQLVDLPAAQQVGFPGGAARVASPAALGPLLLRCGRPKDLARAALLAALPG